MTSARHTEVKASALDQRPNNSGTTGLLVSDVAAGLIEFAKQAGVDACLANAGCWPIARNRYVCWRDDLRRGLETGWQCVRLESIDGRAVPSDLDSASLLVGPAHCPVLIWRPYGNMRGQLRVTPDEARRLIARLAKHRRPA